MITSNEDDTLETVLKKIQTPEDLKGKLDVYTLFTITKMSSINEINIFIQLEDPELWKEIKKVFYPSFFEKIKKNLGF